MDNTNTAFQQNSNWNPSNILVLGGTGKTGKEAIKFALKNGYKVTSMTRDLSKAPKFEEGNVEWLQGTATDLQSLQKAIKGQDSVISTIGPDGLGKTTLYSDSAKLIVQAMKENQVKRLVLVTADFDSPCNSWIARMIVFKLFLNNVRDDMRRMEEYFKNLNDKDIEWTVVRPFRLVDAAYTGKYRSGPTDLQPYFIPKVSRSDVGDYLIKEMIARQWANNFVSIGM